MEDVLGAQAEHLKWLQWDVVQHQRTKKAIYHVLLHWMGTLSCFIDHRGIQEGTFAVFFQT